MFSYLQAMEEVTGKVDLPTMDLCVYVYILNYFQMV